jgi:DNA polymerase III epsilon subunit-like protein
VEPPRNSERRIPNKSRDPVKKLKYGTAAVVDVETTGFNPYRDEIVELAITLFRYDRATGQVLEIHEIATPRAHRASGDTATLLALLSHRPRRRKPYLHELLRTAGVIPKAARRRARQTS